MNGHIRQAPSGNAPLSAAATSWSGEANGRIADGGPPDLYDRLAPFYDFGQQGFDADLGLYLGLTKHARRPVLDLGCGSGRVALALAQQHCTVVGVDRSAAMLALAQSHLTREPQLSLSLVQADMRNFAFATRFGQILIALDGFLHLQSRAEQLACLESARAHLVRGGQLVLDLPGPASEGWEDWSPGVRPLVVAWSRELAGGDRLTKYSSFSADAGRQAHEIVEIYERAGADGDVRRWLIEYSLRYVFPAEIELLLEMAGLQLSARYGSYDLDPFLAESPRQIVIAHPTHGWTKRTSS